VKSYSHSNFISLILCDELGEVSGRILFQVSVKLEGNAAKLIILTNFITTPEYQV
jgi:hypothetical protein